MSAYTTRVQEDLRKIELLNRETGGRVNIISKVGNPVREIVIELAYPTAGSDNYPNIVQQNTTVKIDLLSRYPFQEPGAKITTPIFHPNVYSSGQICFGTKWLPSQGLDLLVRRIIKIITFDESILNEGSPANSNALRWYRQAVAQYPGSFPTLKVEQSQAAKKTMSWSNVDSKAVVKCPNCQISLRLLSGKKGNVTCPSCKKGFYVET
ncbi:ubiquitin-conjugating enzyme E2 [Photobacterium swingsii]|uniref:ubiquitin-conjugating enzyme E2 n=1 Tax=Photobacterium swingsii TaxID=680026 RepID=UPI00352E85A7